MRPFLTLHGPALAGQFYRQGTWRGETLHGLLARHTRARPDAPALRDATRRLTFREVDEWVDGVVEHLHARGLVPGDRVSLWMSNRVETVVALLACVRAGYACNPSLHRSYTVAEVAILLEGLGTAAVFTEPSWGADAASADLDAALTRVGSLRAHIPLPTFPRPARSAVLSAGNPDAVAYLAFTSGTTGVPKCVMHSHNTLLANARDMVRDWDHGEDMKLLSLSPLSHHIAWVGVAQWLLTGGEFIVDNPPGGGSRLDWIRDTGATYVMGVPTHAMDVLAEQSQRGVADLGAVRVFYMAGAPIPPNVAEAFVRQGVKPQNVYGMTENSSHQYTHPDDDTATIIATCGRGGPAYAVRLFDPGNSQRPVEAGEVGEIGGHGAALMLGYHANQAATEASFNRDGWFLSGDLGVLDDRGNLRVVGRSKDIIIRGGHNIHPARIEALALRHPGVERCAVFAVPDDRLGEQVCIAVCGTLDGETLLAHLDAEGLSKYDMPEHFLAVTSFPLTASGKILKRELAGSAKRGELDTVPIRFTPASGDSE